MQTAQHALVLNLHQPAGNLDDLLDRGSWEATEILFALDRIARSLWAYEDLGRVHLSPSGTLLETLSNPKFQARAYGVVKCGDLLWHWQNPRIIEVLGSGYYHPVLPIVPKRDWAAHVERWLGIGTHLFRRRFRGFWPPEMGFCEELIPLISRSGYEFVIVDSEHVEPLDPMSWEEVRYRPHIAEYDGKHITVVVRDRELSNAQESGMDEGWFLEEVRQRTQHCHFVPLVTTATDGTNGGWFRNVTSGSNFWSGFYRPFLDRVRSGDDRACPTFIGDYIDRYGVYGRVRVKAAARNTGEYDGRGFVQWTRSERQRQAFARIEEVSARLEAFRHARPDGAADYRIEQATWRLLRAETSCNFYWGEAWVERCHRDLEAALSFID